MTTTEMVMPKMGESVMEGTVLSWLKRVGESIEEDESILEVATDKVDTEIPATHAGVLKEILAQEGDIVEVGKPIAIIEIAGDNAAPSPKPADTPQQSPVEKAEELLETAMMTASELSNGDGIPRTSESGKFFSPLVRSIAKEENISIAELEALQGSGSKGRVTKHDILAYVKTRKSDDQLAKVPTLDVQPTAAMPSASHQPVPVFAEGSDEVIEMDRMRKMIAERMVASKHISPHVTSFVEADVTKVAAWKSKVRNEFMNKDGIKLTFTPIFIEAIVKAIRDFPMINVQVDGDNIVKKNAINIGMATALPTGNLIVPVVHNADQLSLIGLTKKVNDLTTRARGNKLKPDELQGGTYTVSNVGSFGNVMGTPIIMQPQVAIMAIGAIEKKPSVISTPEGDMIGIRSKMFLSHSYDHRVIDGALGGMFVRKVADYLEAYDINRKV
ncbi:MAG: dihydrolipoamide acetyltransferase family protein [Ekhidna sp.]|nr:dihydrolipoamide acetyltransferase family protein [Ekhidna sp.]